MIEHDFPMMSVEAMRNQDPAKWSNSIAIESGMIADQLARLKAENAELRAQLEQALALGQPKAYVAESVSRASDAIRDAFRRPSTPDPYGR